MFVIKFEMPGYTPSYYCDDKDSGEPFGENSVWDLRKATVFSEGSRQGFAESASSSEWTSLCTVEGDERIEEMLDDPRCTINSICYGTLMEWMKSEEHIEEMYLSYREVIEMEDRTMRKCLKRPGLIGWLERRYFS